MVNKGTGFDLWDAEALLLAGRKKGAAFQVTRFERFEYDGRRIDIAGAAPLGPLHAGLTGRDLILKYSRVPTVPDWQLAKLMDFEVDGIAQQAGGKLSYDFNLLPVQNEMTGEDTVLLALAKSDSLADRIEKLDAAKGSVQAFTPNAVAAYNCYLQFGELNDDVTLVAWIGETSIDLALVRGPNLLFARNVAGGLAILGGAISQAFNVRDERARKIRTELLDLDPHKRGSYASSQEEKVAHAVQGVQGQLQAALRSTLAFCQSQIQIQDLALDRVLLCGPGANVRGMAAFLEQGLNAPVQVWNPVPGCDLSACPPQDAAALEEAGPEAVIAIGLALASCFEDLYSIEILPETVKKRRRFQERTVWNIAAGVAAVAFLGWSFVTASSNYEDLDLTSRRLQREAEQLQQIHSQTEKLMAENETATAKIRRLEELAVPLHGGIRTMRALRRTLPENLWVKTIRSETRAPGWDQPEEDPDVGRRGPSRTRQTRRPILTIQGHGVPLGGDKPETSFNTFKAELDRLVPMVVSSGELDPFEFTCYLDFLYQESKPTEEEKN